MLRRVRWRYPRIFWDLGCVVGVSWEVRDVSRFLQRRSVLPRHQSRVRDLNIFGFKSKIGEVKDQLKLVH